MNEYAFPKIVPDGDSMQNGLTKRELIAAMAMQASLSNNKFFNLDFKNSSIERYSSCKSSSEFLVKQAVDLADELLKELNS